MVMLVGITGGIGAGKSMLAEMLAERGARRVDADKIAREVAEIPGVIKQLQEVFGADILDTKGNLDRRELGRRALKSTQESQRLEQIMRPPLSAAIGRRLEQEVATAGNGIVIFDAPLIYEWEIEEYFDRIVVVDAEEERRLARVQRRSGLPERDIRDRMARQMESQEKRIRADFVIENNGDLAALEEQAFRLWGQLVSIC